MPLKITNLTNKNQVREILTSILIISAIQIILILKFCILKDKPMQNRICKLLKNLQ